MHHAEQAVGFVPGAPERPILLRIHTERRLLVSLRPISWIPVREAISRHRFRRRQRPTVAGQQVVNVHRAGIDVLHIRPLQHECSRVGTFHQGVALHEMRGAAGGVEELVIHGAHVLTVVGRRSIEQPVVIHLAVDVLQRSLKAALDQSVVPLERS